MENTQEILNYLEKMSVDSSRVISHLDVGSVVNKNDKLRYVIDNLDVDRELTVSAFPEGIIPCAQIYTKMVSDKDKIAGLFMERDVVRFTDVVKAGVGGSLEKAILTELAGQRKGPAFLVRGQFKNGESSKQEHYFNLVSLDGQSLYLVDTENPASVNGGGVFVSRYAVPVMGIQDEKIIIPEKYKMGRNYSLD